MIDSLNLTEQKINLVDQTNDTVLSTETKETTVVAIGAQGPEGAPGTDGASAYQIALANGFVGTEAEWLASLSTGGTVVSYEYTQSMPSDTWVIAYPMLYKPTVTVIDSANSLVEGDVEYSTIANELTVRFAFGFSGKAYLS